MAHHPYIKDVSFKPDVPPGYTVWKDANGWRFTTPSGDHDSPEFAAKSDAQMKARAHYALANGAH